jgi:hypothetical protein
MGQKQLLDELRLESARVIEPRVPEPLLTSVQRLEARMLLTAAISSVFFFCGNVTAQVLYYTVQRRRG